MTRNHWEIYAIIRKTSGKEAAEKYRHEIRAKQSKYKVEEPINHWKVCFSDYDGYTKKAFFPYYFNVEQWEEFCENEWINVYSPYDCTGQWFSRDLTRYETKNGTWIYHTLALDI